MTTPARAPPCRPRLSLPVRLLRSDGAGGRRSPQPRRRAWRAERHVLFLDDDLVPAPDLVARHLSHHRALASEAMVIGICPPAPVEPTLAAQAAALWWIEHYRAKQDAPALMFVDVLSGNSSLPRGLFERLGGFDAEFAIHRREDWDFGVRVLRDGVPAVHAADAVAAHEFRLTTRGAIAAAGREGAGDALLAARWPEVAATLPPRPTGRRRLDPRDPARVVLELPGAQRAGVALLDLLERLRARRHWLALFHRLREAAYARERLEAAARATRTPPPRPTIMVVDLADDEPIPPPVVAAPLVEVCWRGRRLGRIRPVDGQWSTTSLAYQLLDAAHPKHWAEIGGGGRASREHHPDDPGPTCETVHVPPWEDANAWRALDARVRRSKADVVVLALWGRRGFRLPPGALDAFDAPRVGLTFGGRSGQTGLEPSSVYSAEVMYWGRDLPCRLVEYVAVRPAVLDSLDGLESWSRRLGRQAFAQELVDRALAAGQHVAQQDIPGRPPPPPGARPTWRRNRAAGGRAARRLARAGPRAGLPEFARAIPWSRRPQRFVFHGAAFASGAIEALRRVDP